jgi:mannose-6-phosphate isomerase-like protein (cupin superfamily)
MPLNKVSVAEALSNVKQPFTMVEVARVGSLVMHAYVCQGTVQWHKHIDHDELFLVQTGWMALESEWGNVVLKSDEMAIVPKGIGHRSSSQMRAIVLLVQPRAAADYKNGHRRIFALPRQDALRKYRLMDVAARADLFRLEPMADMEDLAAQIVVGDGLSPEYVNALSSSLWLVLQGNVQMEAEGELIEMEAGELVVIGQGVPHRWTAFADTTMFLLSRWVEQA